jgi:hypothetical protein
LNSPGGPHVASEETTLNAFFWQVPGSQPLLNANIAFA